jgi:hypothetical protein
MPTTRVTSSSTKTLPPRCTRWQAPTGRYLEPGQTFRVADQGWFKFLAFVEAPHPYVEAVGVGSVKNVRCFRPEAVVKTSKKVVR